MNSHEDSAVGRFSADPSPEQSTTDTSENTEFQATGAELNADFSVEDGGSRFVGWPTLGVVGKRDYAPGDAQSETETSQGGVSSSKRENEPGMENKPISDTASEAPLDEKLTRIRTALGMKVKGYVEAGRILKQEKEEHASTYKELMKLMKARLDISPSYISILITIAENPVISKPENESRLPVSTTALYYLAGIDDATLAGYIEAGEVSQSTTISQAKDLTRGKTEKEAAEREKADLIVSLPTTADLPQVLTDARELALAHNGTLDYRKNEALLGEVWMEKLGQKAKEGIADTKGQLPKTTSYEEMRKLEEGPAQRLKEIKAELAAQAKAAAVNGKTKGKAAEPRLPDEYTDIDTLKKRFDLKEVTLQGFKKGCIKNGIPTQWALADVTQPVYVWYQALLIAERKDEKAARKRLEQLVRAKDRTIGKLALDVLDLLDNMTSLENNDASSPPNESAI